MHAFPGPIVAGIFVGGESRRMGGRPKGLLRAPSGETLLARWRALFDELGVPVVLVGERDAYASSGLPVLPDAAVGAGPLGGVVSLLRYAGEGDALAVACDMPFVSAALVRRLLSAPPAAARAARRDGRWEPFFARYDARRALPIAARHVERGVRSLQALLDALACDELALSDDEARELRDWDTPEDVAGAT